MTIIRSSILQAAAALFGVLLSLVVLTGTAQAQTITNVAEANWEFAGHTFTGQSNLVELQVQPSVAEIRTYVPAVTGNSLPYRRAMCSAATAASGAAGQEILNVSAVESNQIRAGRVLYFSVDLPGANLNPGVVDTIDVVLTTDSGDRERLTVYETEANSGRFTGNMPTERLIGSAIQQDCRLSIANGSHITIDVVGIDGSSTVLTKVVDVLADPFGVVFDSETGEPVNGARVSLVDAVSGAPAQVFAEDGVTAWPSTVISGAPVTDAAGNVVTMGEGEFWFPLTNLGSYQLVIVPPAPYTAPSVVTPDQLALLSRPDGRDFVILDASYGSSFALTNPTPVQIDIPLDRPGVSVSLVKTASRAQAQPGDAIFYTLTVRNPEGDRARRDVVLTDISSPWLRLRRDSIRIDGASAPDSVIVSADGRTIRFDLGDIAGGGQRRVTYAMTIAADAPPGHVQNRAEAVDSLGRPAQASASVEIMRDTIAGRMTIIGRITAGDCTLTDDAQRIGIPGVRVMMEDGSFAITDADGRYHLDGVVPGTHVVQASRMTLPEGGEFIDCTRSSRSQGSAISRSGNGAGRFAGGGGFPCHRACRCTGNLAPADFAPLAPESTVPVRPALGRYAGSRASAGWRGRNPRFQEVEEFDWIAMGDGPIDWLAPTADANPRAPSIRIAVRHRRNQTVVLLVDGQPVEPLAFEGVLSPAEGRWQVSHWRGVPLNGERTHLSAQVVSAAGAVVETLERDVFFTTTPARAEMVPELSNLVADGRTAPVVAVRVLDAAGRPMREGVSGELRISAPYESAAQVAQQQLDQLTRRGNASARWTVSGDEGIALIELAPTMVSGSIQLDFRFDDGEVARDQQLDGWIVPGDIDWTIIGLAEGTTGARSVADNMERTGSFDSDLGEDARVALYVKGRVLGRFLMTIAYDSAEQEDDARLFGTLDPDAYYTVFADGSSRNFDAASRENLYVRIESASFYALYGDFETGFDETHLTRYQRVATGVLAEAHQGQVSVRAFGAEFGTRFRRDEIQGQGISGPYALSSRAIVPNSETVTLEVRDRFRSELIMESRELTRFADYDIDPLAGTITFRQPVLSRDFDLNPQFIVIDYETDGSGDGQINAGVRAEWESQDGAVRVGTTAVTDRGDGARTLMGGMDLRARIGDATEIRAEVAASQTDGDTATAWLIEAQHQTGNLDIIAYARETDADFGVGQQNGVELGRRKVGVDGRFRLSEELSILGSVWQDESHDRCRPPSRCRGGVGLHHASHRLPLGSGPFHRSPGRW